MPTYPELKITDRDNNLRFQVDRDGFATVHHEDGKRYLSFHARALWLFDPSGTDKRSTVINAPGHAIALYDKTGTKSAVALEGKKGRIRLGAEGVDGDLALYSSSATAGDLKDSTKATIWLDGRAGDIKLSNADCAEDFDIAETEQVDPGTVMVIGQEGKLRQSTTAYDKCVAGVISGANGNRPGIVLGRNPSNGKAMPIALSGTVYCKVDAGRSPIQVGDLLSTSDTPGHAMKAAEPAKAFGAVIGKALRPLDGGQGLIPILVALQ